MLPFSSASAHSLDISKFVDRRGGFGEASGEHTKVAPMTAGPAFAPLDLARRFHLHIENLSSQDRLFHITPRILTDALAVFPGLAERLDISFGFDLGHLRPRNDHRGWLCRLAFPHRPLP